MRAPAARARSAARRIAAISASTSISSYVSSDDGKRAGPHVLGPPANGVLRQAVDVRILPDELRRRTRQHAQQVVNHQHLAVAARPGPDTDRGHAHRGGDPRGQIRWNGLEHQAEDTRLHDRLRVLEETIGLFRRPALHAVAAQRQHGLRRQAEMPHHRDLGVGQCVQHVHALAAALDLHRVGAGVPHEASRVPDRLPGAEVIRQPGHVGHQQRLTPAAPHGRRVMEHRGHRDLERGGMSQFDHAERVAHEQDIHTGRFSRERGRRVVRGQHDQRRTRALPGAERGNRHLRHVSDYEHEDRLPSAHGGRPPELPSWTA